MKKQIKVYFLKSIPEDAVKFWLSYLNPKFDVVVTDLDYDYVFVMETIYHSKENFSELLQVNENAIRIFSCGEAIYPDLNLFDYAFSFDNFSKDDRIIKIPYLDWEKPMLFDKISVLDDSKINLKPEVILKEKTKFCNFMYSNPNSHPMRDRLFYEISKYKKVDSLGKHLKNVEIDDSRYSDNWAKLSVAIKRPYKFSIAAENATFNGYTSEKLLTSMMANTIPIYFGNPKVGEEYNTQSFINIADYSSLDEVVKRIKEIDENDDLWYKIMSQPWRTQEQIEKYNKISKYFYDSFYNIFEQSLEEAKRRPRGCWPDIMYPNFYNQLIIQSENKKCKLFSKFIKKLKK